MDNCVQNWKIKKNAGTLPTNLAKPLGGLFVLLIDIEVLVRLRVLFQEVPSCRHRRVLRRVVLGTELRETHHLDGGISIGTCRY